jgi:hypothetical protein
MDSRSCRWRYKREQYHCNVASLAVYVVHYWYMDAPRGGLIDSTAVVVIRIGKKGRFRTGKPVLCVNVISRGKGRSVDQWQVIARPKL